VRPTKAEEPSGFHFAVTHVFGLFCNASAKYAQALEPRRRIVGKMSSPKNIRIVHNTHELPWLRIIDRIIKLLCQTRCAKRRDSVVDIREGL
jgi:hypothetical protein